MSFKRLLICLFISLLFSYVNSQEKQNLVMDPGFEDTFEGFSLFWQFDSPSGNKATLDNSITYEDEWSAKIIKTQGTSFVAVRTNAEIKGGQIYTLSAMAKALPGTPAYLFCYFYDKDGNYLGGSSKADIVSEKEDWHLIGTFFKTPEKAVTAQVRFEMYGPNAKGTAWIDNVYFLEGLHAENIPKKEYYFQTQGSLESVLRFTPEYGVEGGNKIQLAGSFPIKTINGDVNFLLGGLWQDEASGWGSRYDKPDNLKFGYANGLVLENFKVKATGSALTGMNPMTATLGTLSFRFSPYTIDLTGRDRNDRRRGIMFENIAHPRGATSAFMFWDGGQNNRTVGGTDQSRLGTATISTIFVHSQKEKSQDFIYDTVYSNQIKFTKGNSNFNLIAARNWKGGKENLTFSDLLLCEAETNITPNTVLFGIFRDFGYESSESKFDPAYRDAIDWNKSDNRRTAPLDVYMGLKGLSTGIKLNTPYQRIQVQIEKYFDRKSITTRNPYPSLMEGVTFNNFVKIWDMQFNFLGEFYNRWDYQLLGQPLKEEMHRYQFTGSKELLFAEYIPVRISFSAKEEIWPKLDKSNETFKWSERETRIESSITDGIFENLIWGAYLLYEPYRNSNKQQVGLTFYYETPAGITLRGGCALPNVEEPSSMKITNPFGQEKYPDNYIEASGKIRF